jgi:allophanate hydrolase
VKGFVCESEGFAGARDITTFGGWRAYLQSLA